MFLCEVCYLVCSNFIEELAESYDLSRYVQSKSSIRNPTLSNRKAHVLFHANSCTKHELAKARKIQPREVFATLCDS